MAAGRAFEPNCRARVREAVPVGTIVAGLFWCSCYMVVGPWLILVNNTLLQDTGFPYPILISSLGVTASAVSARVVVDVLGWSTISREVKQSVAGLQYYKLCLPIGVLFASTLAFGTST